MATSFDKICRFGSEDSTENEDKNLTELLAKIDLSKNGLQQDIIKKPVVGNSYEEQLQRATYCKTLTDMFNWGKSCNFQLCPVAGKKGFHCELSEGGHFITAVADVQEYRFHKALKEYFQFGYVTGEGKSKKTGKFFKCPWMNEDKTAYVKPGIGLLTGKRSNIIVVDIDNKPYKNRKGDIIGPTGLETFYELLKTYNNNSYIDTMTVRTGSGGFHLYFKYNENTAKLPSNSGYNKTSIDVKNDGGMVVFPGSVHPVTGNTYMFWAGDNNEYFNQAFNNVNEMPEWLLNWLLADVKGREPKESTKKTNYENITDVNPNFLEDLVMNLDDDRAYSHDSYVNIIWAIRNCGGSIDLCYKFMGKCPEKYDRRCKEHKIESAYNQDKYELGLGFLINRLKEDKGGNFVCDLFNKYEMNNKEPEPEKGPFDSLTSMAKFKNYMKNFDELDNDTKKGAKEWVKNNIYIVKDGNSTRYLIRHPSTAWDHSYYDNLEKDFKTIKFVESYQDDEGKTKTKKTNLFEIVYKSILDIEKVGLYDPNEVNVLKPEEDKLNIFYMYWEQFKDKLINEDTIKEMVEQNPIQEISNKDMTTFVNKLKDENSSARFMLFFQHLFNVNANRDIKIFNYIIRWICNLLFRPFEKDSIMLIFHSIEEGSGKTLVADLIKKLIGSVLACITRETAALGRFNSILLNKLFVCLDDMSYADKKNLDELKKLVTGKEIDIEKKGIDIQNTLSLIHLMGNTNRHNCLRFNKYNRRYEIFQCNAVYLNNRTYFDFIFDNLMEDKELCVNVISILKYYDNTPEIKAINVKDIIVTPIMLEIMAAGENSVVEFFNAVAEGNINLGFTDKIRTIYTDSLSLHRQYIKEMLYLNYKEHAITNYKYDKGFSYKLIPILGNAEVVSVPVIVKEKGLESDNGCLYWFNSLPSNGKKKMYKINIDDLMSRLVN